MDIPTKKVHRKDYAPGRDAHNRPTDAWLEPVDVFIYGWQPVSSSQSKEGNRNPITTEVLILLPPRTICGPDDLWTLPIGEFRQIGEVEDHTHGPWWTDSGLTARARKVDG